MKRNIYWTIEAKESFGQIIEYLIVEWSEKEVDSFIERTEKIINIISTEPLLFRKTNLKSVREALITPQTLLVYKIYPDRIDLVTFWDTRRNPLKKPS